MRKLIISIALIEIIFVLLKLTNAISCQWLVVLSPAIGFIFAAAILGIALIIIEICSLKLFKKG